MKTLKRNQQSFWYALYKGKEMVKDENGYFTGEYKLIYGKPILGRGNISANKGDTTIYTFGGSEDYERVIIPDKASSVIDEYSKIWLDVIPVIDTNGNVITPNTHVVSKVAKSLNNKVIAVSKVSVK